ncbi:drug/metabolite transporter (DMT)-like permease [Kitasatospora kifunensis]|uniref:Drug/metabolite transporter (DMT)-like permease n=1 Tax=Kitasatospora kifunensis TaxID=58351 RepID=A0A7W7VV64_KITKI|nr:drug/metabolite transporter (DMT)-like permease [Kitasatospora kifunensis]
MTAVAASTCYGLGSVLQAVGSRRSAREEQQSERAQVTEHGGPSLSSTAKAAVTWEFILGTVLDFVGFLLGALSARLLPLFLSQTVISANLVITALCSIKLLGIRLKRPEWTAIGVVCGALVMLALAAGHEGTGTTPIATHWWLLLVSVVVIAGGALVVRRMGTNGAIVAGLLSGLGFGALGIGVRVLNGVDPLDFAQLLSDPALYAILVGGLGGMYLHTVALQIGSVNGATAALVVGETVVPGLVGVLWLGDATRHGLAWLGVLGFVLAVAGAMAVAHYGEGEGAIQLETKEREAAHR